MKATHCQQDVTNMKSEKYNNKEIKLVLTSPPS